MNDPNKSILFLELEDRNISVGTPTNVFIEYSGDTTAMWTYRAFELIEIIGYTVFHEDGSQSYESNHVLLGPGDNLDLTYRMLNH